MTGKAEFRNRGKVNSLHNDNLEGHDNSTNKNSNFRIKRETGGFMQTDTTSNMQNPRKSMQAKLNKTSKLTRKPVTNTFEESGSNSKGFGMVSNDNTMFNGHNYTVSINFNRPQQSKGKRPNVKKTPKHGKEASSKKTGGWMNNNAFRTGGAFESPHSKPNQQVDNIYDYDIETNKAGYIDIESSTRKRPSRTAGGKKRMGVSFQPFLIGYCIVC
jgi:hypothetical protein